MTPHTMEGSSMDRRSFFRTVAGSGLAAIFGAPVALATGKQQVVTELVIDCDTSGLFDRFSQAMAEANCSRTILASRMVEIFEKTKRREQVHAEWVAFARQFEESALWTPGHPRHAEYEKGSEPILSIIFALDSRVYELEHLPIPFGTPEGTAEQTP